MKRERAAFLLRVETHMRLLCAALLLFAGIGPAAANIRINTSRYENGTLIIAGQTEPHKIVTLDGKYKTKSDIDGDFKFAVHEKPFTCMSNIRSGASIYSAGQFQRPSPASKEGLGEAEGIVEAVTDPTHPRPPWHRNRLPRASR
jgi:hypothetical protein